MYAWLSSGMLSAELRYCGKCPWYHVAMSCNMLNCQKPWPSSLLYKNHISQALCALASNERLAKTKHSVSFCPLNDPLGQASTSATTFVPSCKQLTILPPSLCSVWSFLILVVTCFYLELANWKLYEWIAGLPTSTASQSLAFVEKMFTLSDSAVVILAWSSIRAPNTGWGRSWRSWQRLVPVNGIWGTERNQATIWDK